MRRQPAAIRIELLIPAGRFPGRKSKRARAHCGDLYSSSDPLPTSPDRDRDAETNGPPRLGGHDPEAFVC